MTKQIQLTKGYVALVDDADFEWLSQWKWHALNIKGRTYAVRKEKAFPFQKSILMHRVITNAPKGTEVDHWDRNGLNNTRKNLRVCTRQQNSVNTGLLSTNKSGFKGVYWSKNSKKWLAQIGINYKMVYLGSFDNPEDAARAYDRKAKELHGEFARLNF